MGNQISQLPEHFGDLTSLIRLGLKGNKLTELPASFTQLTSLVELFITDNKLTTLPQGISQALALLVHAAECVAFEVAVTVQAYQQLVDVFTLLYGSHTGHNSSPLLSHVGCCWWLY